MGQFSWCCAVCDQEVMHGRQPGYQWTADAVILWPNGDRRSGRYEHGYGDIAGIDLVDQLGGWRLVHQRCYETVMHLPTAEMFAAFRPERHASDQGWWPGERLAEQRYGPPEMSELEDEKHYVCYGCNRTWWARWSGGRCPFGCTRPEDWQSYRELVEPFQHLSYELETADGVIVCKNDACEHPDWETFHKLCDEGKLDRREDSPPTIIKPCFRYNETQQARITKPEFWDEETRYENGGTPKPFVIACRGCKSTNVEVRTLKECEPPGVNE